VNEIIGVALIAIIFGIAVATVILAFIERKKAPTPLLGVVHPQTPQKAHTAPKTTRKVN
jgi:hypothetical protein